MKQYIDKSTIATEIERRIKECDKLADAAADNNLSNTQQANELLIRQYTSLLDFLDTLEVKDVDLEKESDNYSKDILTCDVQFEPFTHLYNCAKHFYELGLNTNLWKSADGEDLPEIDREVVVFMQKEGLSPRVGIAHRPNPKGWDGTSISTGKTEHFQPMLYGKGRWSLPDVKIWLDCNLPFKEDEI